uniref:Uncharacterized protein n=1 Tax=Syphacia muris TaxID=451379 RepID=A0A0N5AGT6_9BILA
MLRQKKEGEKRTSGKEIQLKETQKTEELYSTTRRLKKARPKNKLRPQTSEYQRQFLNKYIEKRNNEEKNRKAKNFFCITIKYTATEIFVDTESLKFKSHTQYLIVLEFKEPFVKLTMTASVAAVAVAEAEAAGHA